MDVGLIVGSLRRMHGREPTRAEVLRQYMLLHCDRKPVEAEAAFNLEYANMMKCN